MSTASLHTNGQQVKVCISPGVYRGVSLSSSPPLSSSDAGEHLATQAPIAAAGESSTLGATRHRFQQMRDLRRGLIGRPLQGNNLEPSLATSLPPSLEHLEVFSSSVPSVASFGLPFDRLVAKDPVTSAALRIAAAEGALLRKQCENDELKRTVVAQRQEAARMQMLIDQLSTELAKTGQTVLRQTATMKSLATEMERRDAYRLVKERRNSRPALSGVDELEKQPASHSTANNLDELAPPEQQITVSTARKAALQRMGLTAENGPREPLRSTAVEEIDRDDDAQEEKADGHPFPAMHEEIQQLVRTMGRLLTGNRSALSSGSIVENTVYELKLSFVSYVSPSRGRPKGLKSSVREKDGPFVLVLFGPYRLSDVLLRIEPLPAGESLVPTSSDSPETLRADLSGEDGTFYILPHTQGVVRVSLFKLADAHQTGDEAAPDMDPTAAAATAMADLPVETFITAAGSHRRVWDTTRATSSVHTVHLCDDAGLTRGSVTFAVRVTPIQQGSHSSYRARYSANDAITDYRNLPSDLPPQAAASSRRAGTDMECMRQNPQTPNDHVDNSAVRACSPQPEASLLSPANVDSPRTGRGRSSSIVSSSASHRSSAAPPLIGGTLEKRSTSDSASEQVKEIPVVADRPCISSACYGGGGVSASHSSAPASHSGRSAASTTLVASPKSSTSGLRPQPKINVSSLPSPHTTALQAAFLESTIPVSPPPPVLSVPTPTYTSTAGCGSAPCPSYTLWMRVKSMRDLREDSEDAVEDLLEHCCPQLTVYLDQDRIFTLPARRNPSHAVWSADESSCTAVVTGAQNIRFEAHDGPSLLSQAVVPISAIIEAPGEKEVTLMSRRGGTFGRALTVEFCPRPLPPSSEQ